MEELKVLYRELQERKEYLKNRKRTSITNGRISENLLVMIRVQELLIKLVTKN